MKTITDRNDFLTEINRSKFIGVVAPISSADEAKELIKTIKKEYPKANHYCYGYRFDNYEKSSDDGEPSGTAGRPILEFLKNSDLNNLICVVVRYFGGIKLGASGLIRAYIDASKNVIERTTIYNIVEQNIYSIEVDYSLFDVVKKYLEKISGFFIKIEYLEKVKIVFASDCLNQDDLIDFAKGKIKINLDGKRNIYVKVER